MESYRLDVKEKKRHHILTNIVNDRITTVEGSIKYLRMVTMTKILIEILSSL